MDGVAKELTTADGNTAGNEERSRPFVEKFEGKVINRHFTNAKDSLCRILYQANLSRHHLELSLFLTNPSHTHSPTSCSDYTSHLTAWADRLS